MKTNTVLKLNSHYVSDFIKDETDYEGRNKYSLDLQIEESTGAVRQKQKMKKHIH